MTSEVFQTTVQNRVNRADEAVDVLAQITPTTKAVKGVVSSGSAAVVAKVTEQVTAAIAAFLDAEDEPAE